MTVRASKGTAPVQQRTAFHSPPLVRLLAGLDYKSDIEYPLIWLPLPEPWRAGQFAAALRQAGVLVRTADHFAVGRSPAPHAIRISLNSAASVAQLEEGLVILRALLDSPPSMAMDP